MKPYDQSDKTLINKQSIYTHLKEDEVLTVCFSEPSETLQGPLWSKLKKVSIVLLATTLVSGQHEGERRRTLVEFAELLAGERQQQQHGQVPQAAEEELAGAAAVASAVEAERQVAEVQVDG